MKLIVAKLLILNMMMTFVFAQEEDSINGRLSSFLNRMTSGKSLLFFEDGILSDGILISDYSIEHREETEKWVRITVQYTEVGRYYVDEVTFGIIKTKNKKSVSKTASYRFEKKSNGNLGIVAMNPSDPLLLDR